MRNLACFVVFGLLSSAVVAQDPKPSQANPAPVAGMHTPLPAPPQMQATNGVLDANLYVGFAVANVTGIPPINQVWVRAYGLDPLQQKNPGPAKMTDSPSLSVPGPTYIFQPGNLLKVSVFNQLNPLKNPWLANYQKNAGQQANPDEIVQHGLKDVDIPHGPNNTNLHVHGLHVDPDNDDVEIVILPLGISPDQYSRAMLIKPDQQIKAGKWTYRYRIPKDHLPGTHWFHAHKHGSTSTQVENGMAGSLIIRPTDPKTDIVPGLTSENDRVLMLQEIGNYGVQQGQAQGQTGLVPTNAKAPVVSLNGVAAAIIPPPAVPAIPPAITLAPGQLQRWRLIDAGANHRNLSYVYLDGLPMQLVALDGVTLSSSVPIDQKHPVLMAPGTRADVLVQIPADATANTTYTLVKDAPNDSDPYQLGATFQSLTVQWGPFLPPTTSPKLKGNPPQAIAPLMFGTATNGVEFELGNDVTKGRWQTMGAGVGGKIDKATLLSVVVAGQPVKTLNLPSNDWLSSISPTGSGKNLPGGIPGYVAPIPDRAITKRRVISFDISGVQYNYPYTDSTGKAQQNAVNQFSLNGRLFDKNDYLGNPNAQTLIQTKATEVLSVGSINPAGSSQWTNQVTINNAAESRVLWTNPGYFTNVVSLMDSMGKQYYTYNYGTAAAPVALPTYQQVTGINNPGPPVAQSAEEMLLINNSSVPHPFHIHISPFWVTEVGQLNYDTTAKQWGMKTLAPTASLGYVINNWWDTIIIPPHGYVKMRTWINIPQQTPDAASVVENANRDASWVYHCHILRHEDRGMMMIVKVVKANGK